MGPVGTKVVSHESPLKRSSFGLRGTLCWYVGPSTEHYRQWVVINAETKRKRIANTLE